MKDTFPSHDVPFRSLETASVTSSEDGTRDFADQDDSFKSVASDSESDHSDDEFATPAPSRRFAVPTRTKTGDLTPKAKAEFEDTIHKDEKEEVTDSDSDGLGKLMSEDGDKLLALVDELKNIGELETMDILLPQVIVVGNTSSGKSSLLQALTRLPFPVSQELCTRFATETLIRRCKPFEQPGYTITVRRSPNAPKKDPLEDTRKREYHADEWTDVYRHLRDDISETLQLVDPIYNNPKEAKRRGASWRPRQLSEDKMVIEVAKPSQAHFSVVDIPGLTSSDPPEDAQLSEDLARKYIKNPRAIVLAVVNATDALDNQRVLRLAREEGALDRTIAVFTKCDMLAAGDEAEKIQTLRSQKHGDYSVRRWLAVKNRSTAEIKSQKSYSDRDTSEMMFFKQGQWSGIPKDCVGVDSLRLAVSQFLFETVTNEVPKIAKQLSSTDLKLRTELEALGTPRSSPQAQRAYLLNVQKKYNRAMENSLQGIYPTDCETDNPIKLRKRIEALSDDFNTSFRAKGLNHEFRTVVASDLAAFAGKGKAWQTELRSQIKIYAWILDEMESSRGSEAPSTLPLRIREDLYLKQTTKWGDLARIYIEHANKLFDACHTSLLKSSCADESLTRKLEIKLAPAIRLARKRADYELQQLISDNRRRHLKCYNPDFQTYVNRWTNARSEADGHFSKKLESQIDKQHFQNMSADMNRTVLEIHDYLQVYCEHSMNRFVDNIVVQVVERHLLGPDGPAYVFNDEWIDGLGESEFEQLMGENPKTRERRALLERQVAALEKANRTLESYW